MKVSDQHEEVGSFMSSSDSGYPACPTGSCCYLKIVHRIENNNVAYIITTFFQFSFPESMDGVDRLASFKKAKLKASGHPYPIQVTHSIDSIKAPVAGVM